MCYSLMSKAASLGIYFYQSNSVSAVIWFLFFIFLDFLSSKVQENISWKESNAMIGFIHTSHYRINHL